MSRAGVVTPGAPTPFAQQAGRLAQSFAPPLLFGLRLSASVALALYVAFSLELDNPSWAGTTAAVVCQPQLGASLRKASFRLVGTLIGAAAIVVLTACFPQNRIGFFLGLASWGAACGFFATILRNFAAYAASLAGYTAAIIASDALGATGGPGPEVFMLAVVRASEICIGILCAGLVLAGTDFGRARRTLAAEFASLCAAITERLLAAFLTGGPDETQRVRRELIRRVIALDPVIDAAIGEASDLRYRSRTLQAAVGGLFAALSGWRVAARRLEVSPADQARVEGAIIGSSLPQEFRGPQELRGRQEIGERELSAVEAGLAADPARMRDLYRTAARALTTLPADTPSLRLLADSAAEAMLGLSRASNGLALLKHPGRAAAASGAADLSVPDWLPAAINAVRAFLTIGVVELFWTLTAWPSGAQAITFAAIVILLLSPQADRAYPAAMMFLIGACVAVLLAMIVKFAVLPQIVTFAGLSLVMGLVLTPLGFLIALPWRSALFAAAAINFAALLAPANVMSYDLLTFFNSSMAVVAGVGVATLALRLLPPLSPAAWTERLLRLTLQDLRRLATHPCDWTRREWEGRIISRLVALPDQAEPLQRAWLAGALTLGREILRLRNLAARLNLRDEAEGAFAALARGDCAAAIGRLAEIDRILADANARTAPARLRARAGILVMTDALTEYEDYFDAGSPG
ncbi:FUSC family protein [Methylocapsa palsarum]|uniref:Uncharacterized membrane protein YccC n=1 Tax=Methylocapsa palsarum TaxID=1612308 RepID=A0A1I3WX40_9HYPH|nr:FUSC family protein [Methylocapsa palsarum]SFK11943.1 Uncharacterized membrane protein YccC [Methylocapsa palsarum]